MNISKVNLNLLVVLHTLIQTTSVTKAAEKLFVTQSTVSNALSQLRELFEDPLFIRSSRGIEPTAKAMELAAPVADIIEKINTVVYNTQQFHPADSDKTFTIGMSDYVELMVCERLFTELAKVAPNIHIVIKPLSLLDHLTKLDSGEIDLAVGAYDHHPQAFLSETLFNETAVCIGCSKNPILKSKLTMKQYLDAKHIAVYYGEDPYANLTDAGLRAKGIARDVVAYVPHGLAAVHALPDSLFLATIAKRAAQKLVKQMKLAVSPLPFPSPTGSISQMWHRRFDRDPAQIWLRSLIKSLFT